MSEGTRMVEGRNEGVDGQRSQFTCLCEARQPARNWEE